MFIDDSDVVTTSICIFNFDRILKISEIILLAEPIPLPITLSEQISEDSLI
jgi:hypothetical protein